MKQTLVFLLLACLTTQVLAASPPPTIDMTTVLTMDGKPIPDPFYGSDDDKTCAHCPPLTLGHAVAHALFATLPDERGVTGEQKWARGALAEQIKDDPAARLSAEQLVVIKTLLGKVFGVAIVSQAYPLLDPAQPVPAVK